MTKWRVKEDEVYKWKKNEEMEERQESSNGAPWARPGAMPRGPKWGGANFAPPQKRAQGQLPIFYFLT